jgi:hypothetical protein
MPFRIEPGVLQLEPVCQQVLEVYGSEHTSLAVLAQLGALVNPGLETP